MPMMRTIEFVYYLVLVGTLIAALHLADVRPWSERMVVIGWPILIAVSVWFIGSHLPTRRGLRHDWANATTFALFTLKPVRKEEGEGRSPWVRVAAVLSANEAVHLAMFTAILRASSFVSSLAADQACAYELIAKYTSSHNSPSVTK
jgi:hypothetical protein